MWVPVASAPRLQDSLAEQVIQWSALLFFFLMALLIVWLIYAYIVDKTQSSHTIRRNYPIVGRFRYFFEHLGTFFRQYFFSMDREELPFNRAERNWAYRAAKKLDTTVAFGSTRPLNGLGDIIFLNSAYPTLEDDIEAPSAIVFGDGVAKDPFSTRAIINISAMSYGAISKPAVRALSMGAKKANILLNTGEGGLSPYHLEGACDLIFQIGTAKYGVRNSEGQLDETRLVNIAKNAQVKMFEIKLSQGAKPGKGGILPAEKVNAEIANIRGIDVGKASISPNAHTGIKCEDDLLDLIAQVRSVTGKPTGIKFVVGNLDFVENLFAAINRRGVEHAPDFITIDSADGGTGAAPQALIDYVGLSISESLPIVVNLLNKHGLRDRIRVIASGKLITPGRVAWALAAGADMVNSARGFMFALGCIQALQCNKNTCPTGVTTHKKSLQRGLVPEDKAARVAHYANSIERSVGLIAHSCGVKQARALTREHMRSIVSREQSKPYTELYPNAETQLQFRKEQ